MKKKSWTIASLATASGLDVEQVLVALWSEGIEYPLESTNRIRQEDIARAERATGIAASRQKRVSYWLTELAMTRAELAESLSSMGLRLHPGANTVPKGAIRRLRAAYGTGTVVEDRASEIELPLAPALDWSPPGSHRECRQLTPLEIEQIHVALTADFKESKDPIIPPGTRSPALLESAAARPSAGYGDFLKYPSVESAAAALLHSLVHNHPFYNGNKRTALVATLVLLDRNNFIMESTQDELFKFMVRVAAHALLDARLRYDQVADREVLVIANWLWRNSRPIRREERLLTWRELSHRLRELGCDVCQKGEKVTISRTVTRRRRFGLTKTDLLESHFVNTGDGREVPKSMAKRLRHDLQLDAEHGIDAEVFYGDHKDPDLFILEYSKLLKRLARV